MKKILLFIPALLFTILLQAQGIDYDNLAKEYRDIAIQALTSAKPATRKWVEETAAKHPPGKFDLVWVRGQLSMLANSIGGDNPEGGLWAVMLAYQKMLNKEQKEDRSLSRKDAALETKMKEEKMALDNSKIDQQRHESSERYDNSMNAANTQLKTGVTSSATQITTNKMRVLPDSPKQKTIAVNNQQVQKINTTTDNQTVIQATIKKLQDQLAELKKNPNF